MTRYTPEIPLAFLRYVNTNTETIKTTLNNSDWRYVK